MSKSKLDSLTNWDWFVYIAGVAVTTIAGLLALMRAGVIPV